MLSAPPPRSTLLVNAPQLWWAYSFTLCGKLSWTEKNRLTQGMAHSQQFSHKAMQKPSHTGEEHTSHNPE